MKKHVNTIFGKLGLAEEPVHRRVAAVPAFWVRRSDGVFSAVTR